MYCDVIGTAAIAQHLNSNEMLRKVYSCYNHIVQRCVARYNGFVVKTNSITSYLVVFAQP